MVKLPNVTVQTGKQHIMTSFIVVGVFYWTTVEGKELLPDSSLRHLDYGSTSYDLGLCGTSMSGICYIIAKQYWEAWGLFWKRSVSLCILGVHLGFGCFGCVCLVFCCLVVCVGWWHLGSCLTYSLIWGIGNQNKTYWWPSELQARTATAKKKIRSKKVLVFGAMEFMDSGFAKAWRNLQFLDLPDVSFVAGARHGQPYGFKVCESFAQFATFGLARCIFRGRRRTRPTL